MSPRCPAQREVFTHRLKATPKIGTARVSHVPAQRANGLSFCTVYRSGSSSTAEAKTSQCLKVRGITFIFICSFVSLNYHLTKKSVAVSFVSKS